MKKILATFLVFSIFIFGCSKKDKAQSEVAQTRTPMEEHKAASLEPYETLFDSLKSSLEGRDYQKTLAVINSMKDEIWEQVPLMLQNVLLVKGPDNTYGVYEPAEDDVYSEGETIYLYVEPLGYKIIKSEAGYYEFGFSADFQVVTENGEIIGGQEKFVQLPFKSWHPNKEVAITFNYHFSGLPAGKYKIITTVYDANSDKKAAAEIWFTTR